LGANYTRCVAELESQGQGRTRRIQGGAVQLAAAGLKSPERPLGVRSDRIALGTSGAP